MNKTLVALALAAGLGACSSSATRLSFSARTGAPLPAVAAAGTGSASAALAAGTGIQLTRVRMVVASIKLEPVVAAADGGTSADGGVEGEDVVAGPYLVDLSGAALDAGLTQVFEVDVAAGDFKQIKFRIHKLDAADTTFAGMAGLSVAVDGTIDGAPFTFTSSLDEEQEREGTFHIGAGSTSNVTLSLDPAGWFMSGTTRLDPRVETNRSQIETNIKASIDAFEDDNRDGRRD